MPITFRWLNGPELARLEPTFRLYNWVPINYATSTAICAFDGDDLVGFFVLQLFPHTEPMFVAPTYRAHGIADQMADLMLQLIKDLQVRGVMVVADNQQVITLCESRGMTRITSPVYVLKGDQV